MFVKSALSLTLLLASAIAFAVPNLMQGAESAVAGAATDAVKKEVTNAAVKAVTESVKPAPATPATPSAVPAAPTSTQETAPVATTPAPGTELKTPTAPEAKAVKKAAKKTKKR